jgi:hypothetical protein
MLVDELKVAWATPSGTRPDLDLGDLYLTANAMLRDFLAHRTGLQAGNLLFRFTGYDRPEILARVRYLRKVDPEANENAANTNFSTDEFNTQPQVRYFTVRLNVGW